MRGSGLQCEGNGMPKDVLLSRAEEGEGVVCANRVSRGLCCGSSAPCSSGFACAKEVTDPRLLT